MPEPLSVTPMDEALVMLKRLDAARYDGVMPALVAPLERPKLREAWSRVEATTLASAARHFGLEGPALKTRSQRHARDEPGRFPLPIPVEADYRYRNALYSRRELELWFHNDYDLRTVPLLANGLRQQIEEACALVEPISLSKIAERFDKGLWTARSSWRGGREHNGFPDSLPVEANHTVARMFYSLGEIDSWYRWSTTYEDVSESA